ncbi:MAG: hypothetical protein IJG23_03070 [Clostridia bacterium]|nr:hypothetical protein [Clostridia bacterium]
MNHDKKKVEAIVLWGKANRGKTQTLNLVANLLEYDFNSNSKKSFLFPHSISDDKSIAIDVNGKKVGIITAGDSVKELTQGLNSLPNDCDLYICSSHTKGKTCNYLKNRFNNAILWISKWTIKDENDKVDFKENFFKNKANLIRAQEIVEIIKELLG